MNSKITSYCLFLILVFAFSFVNAQEKNGDEMNDENLKGIAKSISISFYNGSITAGKEPEWTSIQHYNKTGKIVSYRRLSRSERSTENTNYSYDDKGHLIKVRYEENGQLLSISIINYDEAGNLRDVSSLDQDSVKKFKVIYKYSQHGKLAETNYYNAADSLTTRDIDQLDAGGNVIESKIYDKNNKLLWITRSHYDKKNNVISYTKLNPEGKIVSNDKYDYVYYLNGSIKTNTFYTNGIINYKESFDTHNNIVEDIMYEEGSGQDVLSKGINKYKYDSKGNWTEKVDYENGEAFTSEVRTIEY